MADKILPTKRPSPEQLLEDSFFIEEFRKEIVKQGDRVDDLAKELFKMELAIPGIYAAVLKLLLDDNTFTSTGFMVGAFACWIVALLLTLRALFTKKYKVLEGVVRRNEVSVFSQELTIKEYYSKVMKDKLTFLGWSTAVFFAGIGCAVLALFNPFHG